MSFAKPATSAANTAPSSQNLLYVPSHSIDPIVPDLYDPSKIPSLLQTLITQMNVLSRNMDNVNLRMDNVELHTQNMKLQASLDTALDRIKELEAAAAPIPHTTAVQETKETNIDPPQVPATLETEPCSTLSKLKLVNRDDPLPPPLGFQHIYLSYRGYQGRQKNSEIRKCLSVLGVQVSRVVKIENADRHVISLLVHNEYAPILIDILAKSKIKPIADFPSGVQNTQSDVNKAIYSCAKVTPKINYI
ncbi:hypothetical protein MFLAVUS_010122 [Mucor flavus]|uniref:Gag-like protein n=1 Tax=Mucor flavus TaxID=439312 RepID=A0ABP9ZBT9_9FUNG